MTAQLPLTHPLDALMRVAFSLRGASVSQADWDRFQTHLARHMRKSVKDEAYAAQERLQAHGRMAFEIRRDAVIEVLKGRPHGLSLPEIQTKLDITNTQARDVVRRLMREGTVKGSILSERWYYSLTTPPQLPAATEAPDH